MYFAPKKDRTLQFCVDYRKLTAVAILDSYHIAHIDEFIDSPRDATIFSTLDGKSGYWQVEVADVDRDKTALASSHGPFRLILMLFGLKRTQDVSMRRGHHTILG